MPSEGLPRFWFGPAPELLPGEEWAGHYPANRAQGPRAVGGGLHFTTRRVLFCPNVTDALLGGQAFSCALADIAEAGIEPARYALTELFSGGLRDRLRLVLQDGRRERFVISGPAKRAAELNELLAAVPTAHPPPAPASADPDPPPRQ